MYLTYTRGLGPYLSPIDGLFAVAPFLILGVTGIGVLWRRSRVAAAALLATEAVYLVALGPEGFRGYAPTGRIVVIATPMLVVTTLLLLHERRRLAVIFGLLAVFGLVATSQAGRQPTYGALYDDHGVPISLVRHVESIWPSFHAGPPGSTRPSPETSR